MNTSPSFPTIGAAVLYLNSFHHGKHLGRLNYLSRFKRDWVMDVANNMWERRNDGPVGTGEHEESRIEFYANLLDWAIPDVYTRTLNGEA